MSQTNIQHTDIHTLKENHKKEIELIKQKHQAELK